MASALKSPPTKPKLWADSVPLPLKPYVQLTRIDLFAGSLLLFWPCSSVYFHLALLVVHASLNILPPAWGLSLAAIKTNMPVSTYVSQTILFLVWSTLLHSVGSTWNDICDKDFDRLVERTKLRPLAAGTISVKSAFLFMLPQIVILLGLISQLHSNAFLLGAFELFFLTPIYPFTKRVTHWPQAWLGIAFTWGSLIAWAANDPPNWPVMGLCLYAGCCWTIYYDTIYATMDRTDDVKVGIKSTAVLFGYHTRTILGFFGLNFILGLAAIGVMTNQRAPFFILSVLVAALHITWQIRTVVFEDVPSCSKTFKSNGTQLGYIIWSGLIVNYALTSPTWQIA